MAMTERSTSSTLLFARNGANRPVHQDRQILRAGDLSLEQATQDAMLARARRYLHGWGVVSGFIPHLSEDELILGPGYGVTPLGDELFLPQEVKLSKVAEVALLCCGPGPAGCEQIDPKELERDRIAAAEAVVDAYLIARPASREALPRPGVPDGARIRRRCCCRPGAAAASSSPSSARCRSAISRARRNAPS